MLFRGIIVSALLVGIISGILLSVLQIGGVTPIIIEAEAFEQEASAPVEATIAAAVVEAVVESVDTEKASGGHDHSTHDHSAHDHGDHHDSAKNAVEAAETVTAMAVEATDHHGDAGHHDHAGHHHDSEAWAPEDGAERTLYTFVSNILAAIGFAAVLLALMTQTYAQGWASLSLSRGALWGAAAFVAIFAVPAVGLPPEIPGIEAAAIGNRQGWWLLAVASSAIGLAVLAFAPIKFKGLSALFLAVPFLVGAPHSAGPAFTHPDPAVVAELTALHQQFIWASAATNLLFWIALGVVAVVAMKRWIVPSLAQGAE